MFSNKKGMIAGLVTATIVGIVFIVMMNEGCLATYRASRIFMNYSGTWSFRCELVITVTAEIFLITIFIFAETIKRMRIVAFRAL